MSGAGQDVMQCRIFGHELDKDGRCEVCGVRPGQRVKHWHEDGHTYHWCEDKDCAR